MLLHKINEGIINIKKDKIKKLIKNLLEVLPDGIGLDKVLGFFLSISLSVYLLKINAIFLAPKLATVISNKSIKTNSFEINKDPEKIKGNTNTVCEIVTKSKANLVFLKLNIKIY